jgi:erythromycin esterase-like protein
MQRIGDARFVLIGEATHGTHEFYRIRAELTKRLIREKGFTAIAAEADWPDAYAVNRYVRGGSEPPLEDFHRFPQWMWRNSDVRDFVDWLRGHNDALSPDRRVGFYGLDLYSLHSSIGHVLGYLDQHHPDEAVRARERYACFEMYGREQEYGLAIASEYAAGCEDEVVKQLVDVLRLRDLKPSDPDAQFEAEQNARVVARAEEYYRKMYFGNVSTWNLRDTHMADTLDDLAKHLGPNAKIVVWAHNSHVGDSAAMSHREERAEITLGHLCRHRHRDVVLVGFTTFDGTVTAASNWDQEAERKRVRPALPTSYEALFHRVDYPRFLLMLGNLGEAAAALHEPRLQRAIGVIYRPDTERWSHYFDVRLTDQLDAVIHIDRTRALEPLDRSSEWVRGEFPETFPTGL